MIYFAWTPMFWLVGFRVLFEAGTRKQIKYLHGYRLAANSTNRYT